MSIKWNMLTTHFIITDNFIFHLGEKKKKSLYLADPLPSISIARLFYCWQWFGLVFYIFNVTSIDLTQFLIHWGYVF